jgi:tetratricopeptide (TPR) repeat protein
MSKDHAYCLGMSAYNAGHYPEAIEHLTPLMASRGPTGLLSRFYVGQAHYRTAVRLFSDRKFEEAAGHFQAATRANPHGGTFSRYLAACHLGTGRLELAGREWERMLREDPADVQARVRLALTQWKQGNALEAMGTLEAGLSLGSEHAELHHQLGVLLAAGDDLASAERHFLRTLELEPAHSAACERLAQCCGATGRHERALGYLQQANRLEPGNARIAWQLAILSGTLARGGAEPPVRIASLPKEARFDARAIEELGRLIAAEPDFVEAFLSLPASEVDEEVFSTLAATLERALREHPEFADLHYHCGEIYQRLGRSGEAVRHVEAAVRINPRYVSALVLLANLYANSDAWAAGAERLEQALEAGADYPDVHFLLGQLYGRGGQKPRARQAFERALELNPGYGAARQALAELAA